MPFSFIAGSLKRGYPTVYLVACNQHATYYIVCLSARPPHAPASFQKRLAIANTKLYVLVCRTLEGTLKIARRVTVEIRFSIVVSFSEAGSVSRVPTIVFLINFRSEFCPQSFF